MPDRRASLVLSLKDNVLSELVVAEAGLDIRKSNRVAIEIAMKKDESKVMGCEERKKSIGDKRLLICLRVPGPKLPSV